MISARLSMIPMGHTIGESFKASAKSWSTYIPECDTGIHDALNTPWQPFALYVPQAMPASPVSYKSLSEHLGDLAKGTTIMGKPQRHWPEPRFGFVADHFVGADVSRPPRTSSFDQALNLGARTPEPADKSGENQVPVIIAPRPIVPLTAVRAAFEVRAYAATLPEVFLTPLSATFDDAASDENARISAATRDHSDGNGPALKRRNCSKNILCGYRESSSMEPPPPLLTIMSVSENHAESTTMLARYSLSERTDNERKRPLIIWMNFFYGQ